MSEVSVPVTAAVVTPANRARGVAYAVTWLSYASYYLGRKGFSVTRKRIMSELGADVLIGVETAYLAAYALGQYGSGVLGDRIGARKLIGYGMLASAVACVAFGASSAGAVFLVAFGLNGLAQSTGWPGNVKAMAEWTTPKNRGAVMGIWSTCYQVGGIAATALATFLLAMYGWRSAFFGPALCIAAVALIVLFFLKPGPGAGASAAESTPEAAAQTDLLRRIAQRRVIRSPVLWCYGISYFNLKLIRYSLLFWLPFYLTTVLGYAEERAGYFSISFEVGGIVGTICIGLLSDRLRNVVPRSVIASLCCVGLAGALFLYARVGGTSELVNFATMALVGFLLFGPDTLISGAAAQDAGGPHAAALAAGVVNGIGSIGGIAQETVTRGVSEAWGWSALFDVFLWLSIASAVCLAPTFFVKRVEA